MHQKKPRATTKRTGRTVANPSNGAPTPLLADVQVTSKAVVDDLGSSIVGDEAVRTRAYYLYLERGGTPGHELEDWVQAEREHKSPVIKA